MRRSGVRLPEAAPRSARCFSLLEIISRQVWLHRWLQLPQYVRLVRQLASSGYGDRSLTMTGGQVPRRRHLASDLVPSKLTSRGGRARWLCPAGHADGHDAVQFAASGRPSGGRQH